MVEERSYVLTNNQNVILVRVEYESPVELSRDDVIGFMEHNKNTRQAALHDDRHYGNVTLLMTGFDDAVDAERAAEQLVVDGGFPVPVSIMSVNRVETVV